MGLGTSQNSIAFSFPFAERLIGRGFVVCLGMGLAPSTVGGGVGAGSNTSVVSITI